MELAWLRSDYSRDEAKIESVYSGPLIEATPRLERG